MRCRLLVLLLCLSALFGRPASAEEPLDAPTDAAAAEVLFQQGREAMLAENYDDACRFFLESLALDRAVGTVMNLATCEEKRGHLTASWERWHQALGLLAPNDDRVFFAEDQLTSISARLAHLIIRVTGARPSDLTIRRDGVVMGSASIGQKLPVDPGSHEVTVAGAGFESKRYTITLESGETEVLVVSPGRAKTPSEATSSGHGKAQRIAAYAAFGIGAAGLTTAIVTGVLLPGQDQKVQENCPGRVCSAAGTQAIADAQTLLALNTAGWIATGVGIAAGSVLLFTLPKKSASARSTTRDAEPTGSKGSHAQLDLTPTGLLIHGTF